MMPVIAPERSMRTRHDSIQVVVSFFGLNNGSNEELPPLGSRQVDMPMPASPPLRRTRSRWTSSCSMSAAASALSSTAWKSPES
jgi:hypothetical protein